MPDSSMPQKPQKECIYLDCAATTPLHPLVLEEMLIHLKGTTGNASSLHQLGQQAKQILEASRITVANCLGAFQDEIYFTSGATEANNWVVQGLCHASGKRTGKHIITTQIEHTAVANPFHKLEEQGYDVTWLPVSSEGFVTVEQLKQYVRDDTRLVSIIHGNNEIGTIQPIEAIGTYLRSRGIPFHIDAVQTIGKLPVDFSKLPVDYASMSAHKLYGPKGVGALYICQDALKPEPLLYGGGQEDNLRSGTENIAAIAGFAKALFLATESMGCNTDKLRTLQAYFISKVLDIIPTAILNGPSDLSKRVPGNVHFSFPPTEGETLVLQLNLKGIAVSSGSACHSAVIEPSRIIKALGKPDDVARATLRFSFGHQTTMDELDQTVMVLAKLIEKNKKKHAMQR